MKKVLLIDDSVTIHRVIDICLDKERFGTEKTFSADDAVIKLKNSAYDIILLDNKLEGIILGDFIAKIRSLSPSAWVILLTGAFDQFDDSDLERTGADDYLFKPFDSQALEVKMNFGLSSTPKQPAQINLPAQTAETPETAEILPPQEEDSEENTEIEIIELEADAAEEELPSAESETLFTFDESDGLALPDTDKYEDSVPDSADDELFEENSVPDPAEAVSDEEKADLSSILSSDFSAAPEPANKESLPDSLDDFALELEEEQIEEPAEEPEELSLPDAPEEDFTDLLSELGDAEPEQADETFLPDIDTDTNTEDDASDIFGELTEISTEEVAFGEPDEEEAEPANDDLSDDFGDLSEIPAEEAVFSEQETEETEPANDDLSDDFGDLSEISADEAVLTEEPEAPAEETAEPEEDDDLFAGLMQIDAEEVMEDKEPEEEKQPEALNPQETTEEPESAEELSLEETEEPETAVDILPDGFLAAGEPLDGEIIEETAEADLSAEALETMPIEADFSEFTQITEDELEDDAPEISEETEPEEAVRIITVESPVEDGFPARPAVPAAEEAEPETEPVEDGFPVQPVAEEETENDTPAALNLAQSEIKDIVYRSLDSGMLKAAIQEVLSEKMEEVLREVLPEIAEMVIREEIERLKRGE